ncbi:hypothetical protein IC582_007319 [Cucumis melo]
MTPEEEQLKIASGELFENLYSSTIIQSKNVGLKREREVVNDEGDFKKSKKQKSKSEMKKAIRNLQDRVAVVEGILTSIKSDIDKLKCMTSTILKHIRLQRKVRNKTVNCIDVSCFIFGNYSYVKLHVLANLDVYFLLLSTLIHFEVP